MSFRNVTLVGLLCFLLAGTPALWATCPVPCPGDLNGDCRVDFWDFSILARHWLDDCTLPASLPVLRVTSSGITADQLAKLSEQFGINPEMTGFENGEAVFVDPMNFQKIPTTPLADQQLADELRKQSEIEPGGELAFDVLSLDGLAAIQPMADEEAMDKILIGLSRAEIGLGDAEPMLSHATFELVDLQGNLLLPAVQLDTSVNMQMYAGGIPIIGPGAQVSMTLDPQGAPTQMTLASRQVSPEGEVALMTPGDATAKLSAALGGRLLPEDDIRLVYYAPPLSEPNVQILVPHYDIGGILYGAEGQQATKLRRLVPATSDPRFVPTVELSATARGDLVNAQAAVSGGQGPYRFQWFSSTVDLSDFPQNADKIEYNAAPRTQEGQEVLTVQVTDKNGIVAQASISLQIIFVAAAPSGSEATLQAGGVRDFGVERGVSDLGAANQSGFVNRFLADGVYKRFNFAGASAWEQDFKQPPAGTDTTWVDNADIVFYIGHGYGGGFTFESTIDDKYLTTADAAGAWGNYDLEWLSLLSCEVLKDSYGGDRWWTRWGPAFDGLHLLTGFQTTAYDWHDFGGRYADYMLGRHIGFVTITLPVRSAWFMAKKEEQPSSVQAVVMGVVGPGGVISGYNDYFWGKGPVSADLRGSNITNYWRIVYQ